MRKRRPTAQVCATPGCPQITEPGESHCPDHRRAPWAGSAHRERTMSGWQVQARARRILQKYGGRCHVCGLPGASEVDHVIPLAHGGADDETNLRPIHADPCHREKTNRESHG